MKISREKPPIWDEAHKHFDIDDAETVYTYGDTLYNPGNIEIGLDLIAHESTHKSQQANIKGGPKEWWNRYFTDTAFRKQQEVEAYAEQYKYYCHVKKDRNLRALYLNIMAGFLASRLYKLEITQSEASSLIRHSPTPLMDAFIHRGRGFEPSLTAGEGSEDIKK